MILLERWRLNQILRTRASTIGGLMAETQPEEKLSDFEKDLRSHPAFAKTLEDMQDSPAFQALQALKYESENPNGKFYPEFDRLENAQSYKEEGNYHVERGEFNKAVTAYGAGIAAKPTDKKLLAVLYTNRGIAQARMKNYGSCVQDCKSAIKCDTSHTKAYVQAVKTLLLLSKYKEAVEMCKAGLEVSPSHEALTELKRKSEELEAKSVAQEAAKQSEIKNNCHQLVDAFKQLTSRGIVINMELPPIGLPESAAVQISFDHLNKIHWPVLFMYPEFGQTDFVQDVAEYVTVKHCLKQLLTPSNPPPWDVNKHYTSSMDELEIFYEDCHIEKQMIAVPITSTLTEVSKSKGFSVRRDLVMILIVVSKLSKNFYKKWMENLRG
ncbi:Tetratricopeptide repeat protein 4 [Sparganum proliferum]